MKKTIVFISTCLFIGAMLTSCNKSTPKDVARDWLVDFYHMDYDAAKKLSTEETKLMINTIQGFSNSFADSIKQKAKQVTITIKDVKVDGDKAVAKFIASNDPTNEESLKLVKQNDKWLVLFTKSDFKPAEDKEGNTGGATISPDPSATVQPAQPADASMTPDTAKQQ